MRLRNIAPLCAALTALLATGLGTVSAEETGPNAWCFRPAIYWIPVATESYAPRIECEPRELPQGGAQWASDIAAELAVAPDGWSLPRRSQGERTRWGWTHGYDASGGNAWIYGEMRGKDGQSPVGANAPPDVWLSISCPESGQLRLSLLSDVEPLHGEHAVVWWTDRGEYRRAETWKTRQPSPEFDQFIASAPFPNQLWAEIRDSSRLYVLIFGDQSWRMAEAFVSRINQLDVLKTLDYCGQNQRAEAEAGPP